MAGPRYDEDPYARFGVPKPSTSTGVTAPGATAPTAPTPPSAPTAPLVFWGWNSQTRNIRPYLPEFGAQVISTQAVVPETQTTTWAKEWFDKLRLEDPQKYAELRGLMADAGMSSLEAGPDSASSQWSQFIDMIAQYYAETGVTRTPKQYLKMLASAQQGLTTEPGGGAGGTPAPQSSTSVMSPSSVRAMGESAYQSELGRNPTPGEIGGLQSSATSTTTYGKNSATTTGGANLQQLAVENARSQDDFAEYQAAGPYFNALLGAIGRVA